MRRGWMNKCLALVLAMMLGMGAMAPALSEDGVSAAAVYAAAAPGDSGDTVTTLQLALKELGFYTAQADGVYGSGTKKAVLAYQKANGLPQTGEADAATQQKLYEEKSVNSKGKSVKVTTASTSRLFTLLIGHTGPAVAALQTRLNELGYYLRKIDGEYGNSTASSVKAFQKANGLKQTGRADALTQQSLYSESAVSKSGASKASIATPEPTEKPAADYPFTTYTLDTVNMRRNASAASDRIALIGKGEEITVLAVSADFVKATYQNKTGYIASEYVKIPQQYLPGQALSYSAEAEQHYPLLQSGDSGRNVGILQEALKELGFYKGLLDGAYGASTAAAVKAFQKKNDLRQDGIASPEIQQLIFQGKPMNSAGKKVEVSVLPMIKGFEMKLGDHGDAVADLQHQLILLGIYQGQPSGVFDAETEKAVKQFQRQHGLYIDGVAGAKTQQLLNLLAVTPTPVPYTAPEETPAPVSTATPAPGALPDELVKSVTEALNSGFTPAPTLGVTFAPPAAADMAALQTGSTGVAVAALQQRLTELGYYERLADGVFTDADAVAVKEFQRVNGLTVTGIATPETQQILHGPSALPANPIPRPQEEVPAEEAVPGQAADGESVTVISTAAPNNVVKLGDKGEKVQKLQRALRDLGYYSGEIDGDFGDATLKALKEFQKANKLDADGVAGDQTMNRLNSSAAVRKTAPATATPAPTAKPGLSMGSTGDAVRDMQQRLKNLGYTVNVDGVYGNTTYQAVLAFQKRNGLTEDGIAGEATLQKIASSSALPAAIALPSPTIAPTTRPAALYSSPSASFAAPAASQVKREDWFNVVRPLARQMPEAVIYQPQSGLHFTFQMFSFGKHADGEPATPADTAVLNQICGENSWTPHFVWVVFPNGQAYIASIHSHGHGVDHAPNNDMEGHICLHFPRPMSEAQETGPYAVSHQREIIYGWEITQAMQ